MNNGSTHRTQTPVHPRRKFKTNDPQLTVEGQLKPGEHTDLIVFTIPLAFFEIVCIVNVPPEGEVVAPVYCKFKMKKQFSNLWEALVGRELDYPNRAPGRHESKDSRPGFTVDDHDE